MKKFNRVLYAIISDMFEKLIADNPSISNDDIMQNMYQEFDETMQIVFDDLNSVTQITEITSINIDGDEYTREEMIDMLVNGIAFNSKDVRTEVRSLIRHLNASLDEAFVIYPMIIDGHEGDIVIERKLKVEANISIGEDRILLLQGEGGEPDISLFKAIYPEIIKWIKDQDEDDEPPERPAGKSKFNKIKKTDAKEDAIEKARNYMKNRFDYL